MGEGETGKTGARRERTTGSAGAIRAWRARAGARVSGGVLGDGVVSPGPGEDVRTVCSQVPSPLGPGWWGEGRAEGWGPEEGGERGCLSSWKGLILH